MITIDTNNFPNTPTPTPTTTTTSTTTTTTTTTTSRPRPLPTTTTTNPQPPPRVWWRGYCAYVITIAQRIKISMSKFARLMGFDVHNYRSVSSVIFLIYVCDYDYVCWLYYFVCMERKHSYYNNSIPVSLCHIWLGFVEHSTWFYLNCPKQFVL